MRRFRGGVLLVGVLLAVGFLAGLSPSPARAGESVAVELFVRPGCPHCERAEAFLDALRSRRAGLGLQRFDVSDPDSLARLQRHAETTGTAAVGVPAVLVDGTLFIGFDDAATTGRAIEAAILRAGASASATVPVPAPSCPTREEGPCDPVPEAGDEEVDGVRLPMVGVVRPQDVGFPLFTIALGLVDGFNPCAMWVLLYLLAILVHVRSRSRMLLIAATFVAVSGFVYFAFMAAWLNAFGLMGAYRPVQVVLGTLAIGVAALNLKDFVMPGVGPSLSIPESRKPGLYARVRRIVQAESLVVSLVLVSGLALAVNMVELMCTAGLPAIYTHVLSIHELPAAQRYGYLVLYNLAYVFDDSIMVGIAVTTLSRTKLQQRGGRVLKLLSGVVILVLGLLLLFAPDRLSWG